MVLVDMTITRWYGSGQIDLNNRGETTMIPASLPFEYLHHVDLHKRVRRMGSRPIDSYVRRGRRTVAANDRRFGGPAKLRVRPT